MKAEHAAPLIELTSSKCISVKYDVEIAEEYFARQVRWWQCSWTHRTSASVE